uniref:Uncharacterized protein n=1 Tax=Cacopsylla melanoneura TaxID=428564 RepID=A0A8D8UUR3_9HEMI
MLVPCTLVLLAGGWVTAHNQEDVRNKVDLSDIYGEYGPNSPVPKGQAFRRTVAPLVHVSDEDIMKFTDDLLDMDQHNCGRYITLQNDPKKKNLHPRFERPRAQVEADLVYRLPSQQ